MAHQRIETFELIPYKFDMTFGGFREGLVIEVWDNEGNVGRGECAPLPGRNFETLEEASSCLEKFRVNLLSQRLTPLHLPPSAFFAIDSALYSLVHGPYEGEAKDTTLVMGKEQVEGRIKVKLGKYSLEEALSIYRHLREQTDEISIDLNRKWPLEKSIAFCKEFEGYEPLYIEDPVDIYKDLTTFHEESGVSFAVDEFLPFQPIEKVIELKGLYAIICKPMLMGGREQLRAFKELVGDTRIIFSSTFETEVGLNAIRRLSEEFSPGEPVGTGTLRYFANYDTTSILRSPFSSHT